MEIEAKICEIVREVLCVNRQILPSDTLDTLYADSLDRVGIALYIESDFGVSIEDGAEAGWKTVQEVIDAAQRKIAA